ncbi:MAG: VOC family protein [Anaerolineae bacterium]|nr:VOC family protein [Anaerolineae bacterium]
MEDIERSAARYREILGLDVPDSFQVRQPYSHTRTTYLGQPSDARAKMTSFRMGGVSFELIQPLDDSNIWMDFLKQHGEGIHHVALKVPRTAAATAAFADQGYEVTQQGLFAGRRGMFTYLDTEKDLGLAFELLEFYDGEPQLQAAPFPADKGIGTDLVCQVGMVVEDIEGTAARYREVLDLPEPRWVETPGYEITETTFNGEPSEATAKLAFFDFGQAQLELIQPDQIPSVWRNYLNEKGDSAHHIAFQVKDSQRAVEHFAEHGIKVVQQGLYGDRSGMYTYMDSEKDLGIIIELLESFDKPR